jgi:hypothetical protein
VAACIFYYIAVQSGFDESHTWVGANAELMADKGPFERYVCWVPSGGEWTAAAAPCCLAGCL